ncbi:MAG TPA: 2-C-methyl-D-erythritol 4-phosphate cytidylyltransferase [Actinobacteria bacterium]|nr:2-C-methyl-D-erythritol 4-phosphate cytidylyltransferase [Actinomycetota bacterium]
MSTWAIVVAAGAGRRFGGPKHEALLAGEPLWRRAVSAVEAAGVDGVVVVGPVPGGVPGGARRRDSVAAGLAHVPEGATVVVVHDAARPLASPRLVEAVVRRVGLGDVDGVVPAVPVRDTLKVVTDGRVVRTVDRSRLVAVQTPQAFAADVLRAAHEVVGPDEDVTDDAGLVEAMGGTVVTIPGEVTNLKVTFPDDLRLAAAILETEDR